MATSRLRLLRSQFARVAMVGAGLALFGAAPASAQWLGMSDGPIPPGQIVGSLMRRGFLEVGRPRFNGDVYVVEGVTARGVRVRLVLDAFEGDVISRTRLDDPLLPPGDVGRDRTARIEPFRGDPPDEMEEEFVPSAPRPELRRGYVEREELLPPQQRRSDLPPVLEPRRGERIAPPEAQPPAQRQARRPEAPTTPAPSGGRPGQAAEPSTSPPAPKPPVVEPRAERPKETAPATAIAPKPPAKTPEARPTAPPAPAPSVAPSGSGAPAAQQAQENSPPKSVRVIEGVTPVVPKTAEPSKTAEPPKATADRGREVTVPPAPLQ